MMNRFCKLFLIEMRSLHPSDQPSIFYVNYGNSLHNDCIGETWLSIMTGTHNIVPEDITNLPNQ